MRCPSCDFEADPARRYCPVCSADLYPGSPPPGYGPRQPPAGSGPPPQAYGAPPQPYGAPVAGSWPVQGAPEWTPDPRWDDRPTQVGAYPAQPAGGYPSGGYPPEPKRGNRMLLALIGVGLAVMLVFGVILILKVTGGGSADKSGSALPDAPKGTAASGAPAGAGAAVQAQAVDALLKESKVSRDQLGPALTKVDRCTDAAGGVADLERITAARVDQLNRAKALTVDQLDNGAAAQDLLVKALDYSVQADQHFTTWATGVRDTGCQGAAPRTGDYQAASAASNQASAAKREFVKAWNAIAGTHGVRNNLRETDL